MKAQTFYETAHDAAVPLYLISQTQWEGTQESLSSQETNVAVSANFSGKLGDYCCLHDANGFVSKVYIGTGDGNYASALAHVSLALPPGSYQVQATVSQGDAIHWALAQYQFDAYKKETKPPRVLVVAADDLHAITTLAESLFLVRDLINTPTNDLGPKEMAACVEQLAHTHGAQFQQWVGDALLQDNFQAIYAVGKASASPPRLLSLTWGDAKHPLVTLVGKGVCFDSGGLNLKQASGMRLMKKDMGGAAHVIGLAQWIMSRKLALRLQVLIPAVENAIGSHAMRPGDVLTMRNHLTVEVDNTDAEGRLVLADALVKACEDKPALLIDFSTLTGAARVALGTDVAVMFTNNDALATDLMQASEKTADPMWRLPLYAPYEKLIASNIADLSNCHDSPYGGAIVAALFLQHFVNKNIPWVHFDIMAWNLTSKPGKPVGGEALGFRAVAEYLLRMYGL